MVRKQSSAIGLCLVMSLHPALADDWFSPALPQCQATGESRTPMPIWTPALTQDGKLSSEPPAGDARIVYIDLLADNDDVHCVNALDNEFYTFHFSGRNKSGDLEVKIRGPARYVAFGAACSLSGFYVSEVANYGGKRQTNYRPVDKFDVMSSGSYCRGRWTQAAPARLPQPRTEHPQPQSTTLPACKRSGEDRAPITVWRPGVVEDDLGFHLSSEPPQGDGRIVDVSIIRGPADRCPSHANDAMTMSWPYDEKNWRNGGIEVNFRGNARVQDGRCVLEGFYMNQPLDGVLQGYIQTFFGAVDERRVIGSGTYCLAEQEGRDRGPRK